METINKVINDLEKLDQLNTQIKYSLINLRPNIKQALLNLLEPCKPIEVYEIGLKTRINGDYIAKVVRTVDDDIELDSYSDCSINALDLPVGDLYLLVSYIHSTINNKDSFINFNTTDEDLFN